MNKKIFELIKSSKVKTVIPFNFSSTGYSCNGGYINGRNHYSSYVGFTCYHSWNASADINMTITFPNPIGSPATLRVQFNGLVHGYLNNSRIIFYYTDNTNETISLGNLSLNYNKIISTAKKHKKIKSFQYLCTYYHGAGGQSSNAGVNIYPVSQTVWK